MGLIEKIFINYGPHRKDFNFFFHYKSMRAVDHQGLGQFAPKRLDWQDLSVCMCVCVGGGGGGGGGGTGGRHPEH